jgi:hypothetical protein
LMMLMWLRADGSHQPASRVTHLCAVTQYWARSTVVHSVRLAAGGHKEYSPIACNSLDQDDPMIAGDDEGVVGKYVTRLSYVDPITTLISQSVGRAENIYLAPILLRQSLHPVYPYQAVLARCRHCGSK